MRIIWGPGFTRHLHVDVSEITFKKTCVANDGPFDGPVVKWPLAIAQEVTDLSS